MLRRLRIGIISPSRGSSFDSNAASYPPPSALSTPSELLPYLRGLNSKREDAIRVHDEAGALRFARLFLESAKRLDSIKLSSLSRNDRLEAVRFKGSRDRLKVTLQALLPEEDIPPSGASADPLFISFRVPEHFSGFGKTLKTLNKEILEIQTDPNLSWEVKVSLETMIDAVNSRISSDASDISRIHRSKQYIASLKISDHYERAARELLWCARARDLSAMVKMAGSFGINLPKLLYKKGIYLKMGKGTAEPASWKAKKL